MISAFINEKNVGTVAIGDGRQRRVRASGDDLSRSVPSVPEKPGAECRGVLAPPQ
jgi:hypothetical protein